MLYLAGQILVLMAAALAVGALLTWVFLLGPVHRRVEEIRRATTAPAAPGTGPLPVVALPADTPAPAGTPDARPTGPPGPPAAAGDDALRTRPASRLRDDGLDDDGPDTATGAEPSAGGAEAGSVPLAHPGTRSSGQPDDHQQDEWLLEKAALTARLTAAERQAVESEQRVTAAERQAAIAGRRVQLLEDALAEAEEPGVPDGAAASNAEEVQALAAEAAQLRRQLAEAEERSAKFSSRLAMARTEAEDAQRQVVTLTTRLDRHQAEWAAEKVRLLAQMGGREQPPAASEHPRTAHVELDLPDPGHTGSAPRAAGLPDVPVAREPAAPEPTAGGGAVAASHPDTGVVGGRTACAEKDRGDADPRDVWDAREAREGQPSALPDGRGPSGRRSRDHVFFALPAEEEPEFLEEDPAVAAAVPVLTARPVPGAQPDRRSPVAAHAGTAPVGSAPGASAPASSVPPGVSPASDGSPTASSGASPAALPGSVALAGLTSFSGSAGSGGSGDSGGSAPLPPPAAMQGARQDNLKEIVGIGPVVEARLHALGIVSFRQLADLNEDGVSWLGSVLEGFGDRIVSDDWVGQASSLHERHHRGLVQVTAQAAQPPAAATRAGHDPDEFVVMYGFRPRRRAQRQARSGLRQQASRQAWATGVGWQRSRPDRSIRPSGHPVVQWYGPIRMLLSVIGCPTAAGVRRGCPRAVRGIVRSCPGRGGRPIPARSRRRWQAATPIGRACWS
ncbi:MULTISPECIES: hypothetical protein [Protofrankia]|uniref:Uncharacterized protein n=1 Tax=Candidatus Protofrankia datiscae TaxID=2716812 RepID=F8B2K1_9ACTN|nr:MULTISPECIES: hypothetical protein [Protofrankia]AEH08619.1 hypothetical protein FsymDg_1119 [Candidatus Protofrankia datiscae]